MLSEEAIMRYNIARTGMRRKKEQDINFIVVCLYIYFWNSSFNFCI